MWSKNKVLREIEPHQDVIIDGIKGGIGLTRDLPLEYRGLYDSSVLAHITFHHIWAKIKELHDPTKLTVEFENSILFLRTKNGLAVRIKKQSPSTGMPVGIATKQSRDFYSQEDFLGATGNLVLCYEPDASIESLLKIKLVCTSGVTTKHGRPLSDWDSIIYDANESEQQSTLVLPENDIPAVQKRITLKAKRDKNAG